MANRLTGKCAIVTGGASGIGRAIAAGFAAEGARVWIADVGADRCATAAQSIGGNAFACEVNLRDLTAISHCVERIVAAAGRIDALVNSAGVFGMQPLLEISATECQRIFDVNFRGTLFMMQAVARRMVAQGGGGTIVSIASNAGRRAAPMAAVYSASKAAVVSLTQCAAQELIGHGIRVNAIAPGPVRTPMWDQVEAEGSLVTKEPLGSAQRAQATATPIGRMSTPQEYVGAAIFLSCDDSSYVVGQTINVDGGAYFG